MVKYRYCYPAREEQDGRNSGNLRVTVWKLQLLYSRRKEWHGRATVKAILKN